MNTLETIAVASRSFSKNQYLVNKLKEKYLKIILNETGKTLHDQELIEFLSPADKAIIGIEKLSDEILQTLPRLKVISKYGVGLNNLDMESMRAKGIGLGFTPGVNKQSVAELALTLTLIALRKIHNNHLEIMNGHWSQDKGSELHKKTVGLLGFGNIGQKFAALLQPFNCKFIFFDEKKFNSAELLSICNTIGIDKELIKQEELPNVMKQADILSIHLPLLAETENIISSREMQYLNSEVCIINTARGGIINELDLHKFLLENPKAFAAFDVYKEEPVVENSLFKLPNFFGTSHRSSLTFEGVNAMGLAAIEGLDNYRILT